MPVLLPLALLLAAAPAPAVGDLSRVGTVYADTSCALAVKEPFARGVALLHSFFYEEAERVFREVLAADPKCAIAHWGVAMTYWHPIWTPPSDAELASGRSALAKAKALGGQTAQERGLIGALETFYATAEGPPGEAMATCHGASGNDHPARALAYEGAMARLATAQPDDVEVQTFYALALLGAAAPADKTLAKQLQAAGILERLWTTHPTHPGIIHYLIHAYDYPSLASRGLPAARAYAAIAPRVPHVLHMPAHIFTRLGLWPDVITSNLASADAARQYQVARHPDAVDGQELHALDYLVYGYLQRGEDDAVKVVMERLGQVGKTYPEVDFASAYAMGAIPARDALERHRWDEAAALPERAFPAWTAFPAGAAHVAFARGLGAAHTGKLDEARRAVRRLGELAATTSGFWAKHAGMQARLVEGWIAVAEKRDADAETILRAAADEDDALGKHPVSPGTILPAREILGDFLAERGRSEDALTQYEKSLALSPGRFNSLAGAGRAAEKAGKAEAARRHYAALVAMVAPQAARPEIEHARGFLAGTAERASR